MSTYEAGTAMRQTSLLMLLQLSSRVITFMLNALVVRSIGPSLYGVASVQFYLVYTTILFLAREGLRRACQRSLACSSENASDTRNKLLTVVNLTWFIGIPIASLLSVCLFYFARAYPAVEDMQYEKSLLLFVLSALIEMVGEPLYIISSSLLFVRLRVYIELCAVLFRTFVTAVLVLHFNQALLAFAWAQFTYSIVITLSYYLYFARRILSDSSFHFNALTDLIPQRLSKSQGNDSYLPDASLLRLVVAFSVQSFEKLLLTEGEKFVLAGFSTQLEENGIYSLVQNLGSLVARMIFQPLEESAYSEFSNLLGHQSKSPDSIQPADQQKPSNHKAALSAMRQATTILATLLKAVTLVGLVFACFGPPNTHILFECLYGARWTAASTALSYYCIYVLLMAINGISESFVLAALPSPADVHRYNVWLAAFSAVYLVVARLALPYGAAGLICANCVNFGVRIAYAVVFIRQFLGRARALEISVSTDVEQQTTATARPAEPLFMWNRFVAVASPFTRPLVAYAFLAATCLIWLSHWLLDIGNRALKLKEQFDQGHDAISGAIEIRQTIALMQRYWTMAAFGAHVVWGACVIGCLAYVFVKVEQRSERPFLSEMKNLLGARGKTKTT